MKVGPLNCTLDYIRLIAKCPIAVSRTLLGGDPDRNRRTIEDMRTGRPLAAFNQVMADWTPAMQRACDVAYKAFVDNLELVPLVPDEFDALMAELPDIIGRPIYQRGDDVRTVWPKYGVRGNHTYGGDNKCVDCGTDIIDVEDAIAPRECPKKDQANAQSSEAPSAQGPDTKDGAAQDISWLE